jgi:glycosyltransferase involved in cell wall biosynthesis
MCVSLAKTGIETHLVAINAKEGIVDGVQVHSIKSHSKGRLCRILINTRKVLAKAISLNSDIYHIHDPELIPFADRLLKRGKIVIYDSHEDVPSDILDKAWLGPLFIRKITSFLFNIYEKRKVNNLQGVISVSKPITNNFLNKNKITIHNYPDLSKFFGKKEDELYTNLKLVYCGGLNRIRGVKEMIESLSHIPENITLYLAGNWESELFHNECKNCSGWSKVRYLGYLNQKDNYLLMNNSHIGIINYLPVSNHLNCLPNKIYEYFASGLVVLMSNIEFWQREFHDKAFYHDPKDSLSLASQIKFVYKNKNKIYKWGKIGNEYIRAQKSWESESEKLIQFYKSLLST